MNKRIIINADKNNKNLRLAIQMPGHKILQEAQMIYNIKITELINQGVSGNGRLLSRQQLEQHLNDLGIWTDKEAKKFIQLQLELRSLELKLKQGGIKVSEGKRIALELKIKRAILLSLYHQREQFDSITMESIAENEKFKFLITKCVVLADENIPLFTSVKDYEEKQNQQFAIDAATALAELIHGYDKSQEINLIENQWLRQFKFADDQGRLINNKNQLVDVNGRLIDEDGHFIDENGNLIDDHGRKVDSNGEFIVTTKPFIDDESGESVILNTKKNKKKKRK